MERQTSLCPRCEPKPFEDTVAISAQNITTGVESRHKCGGRPWSIFSDVAASVSMHVIIDSEKRSHGPHYIEIHAQGPGYCIVSIGWLRAQQESCACNSQLWNTAHLVKQDSQKRTNWKLAPER